MFFFLAINAASENAFEQLRRRMIDYEKRFANMESELIIVKKKLTLMRRHNHYGRILVRKIHDEDINICFAV